MNDKRLHALPSMGSPIAEADLHAYADGQLAAARRAEVETFLAAHPQDRARVDAWQAQRQALRSLLDPVLDEPLPLRLPLAPPARAWPWRALAAGIAVAVFSGARPGSRAASWTTTGSARRWPPRRRPSARRPAMRSAPPWRTRSTRPTWAGRLKSAATTKGPGDLADQAAGRARQRALAVRAGL